MTFPISIFWLAALNASLPTLIAASAWQGCSTTNAKVLDGDRLALQGRFKAAQRTFEAGLAEAAPDPRSSACLMDRLARNLRQLGRHAEAESWALRAIEFSRTLPEQGTTAVLANNLAGLYFELKQIGKAELWAKEAVQLATQAFGPEHPETQLMWTTTASIYAYQQDFARAEPILRRALHYLEQSYGPDHVEVALAASNLADNYRAQHLPQQAIRFYLKALTVFELKAAVAQKQILLARSGLMLSYSDAGQTAEAGALVAQTLRSAESLLSSNDPDLAVILHYAALVRLAEHKEAAARVLIEQALRILEGLYGSQASALLAPLRTYEQILRTAKDGRTAKLVETRVRRITRLSAQ